MTAASVRCLGQPAGTEDSVVVGRPRATADTPVFRPHPDKAISQRATLLAGLASGVSRITGLADCNDTRANLDAVDGLGISCRPGGLGEVLVDGVDGRALAHTGVLDAGNSATTSRLLLAVLAGGRSDCTVTGNALLRGRPMHWLVDSLRQLGGDLRYEGADGRLPVVVSGRRLRGGTVDVLVDSAQAVSPLLFAATLADDEVVIRRRTAARDHTERLLRWSGVLVAENDAELRVRPGRPAPFDLMVPGDPSGAAVLAAVHLATAEDGEPLRLTEVCLNERRLGFFRMIAAMGVPVEQRVTSTDGPEPVGTITVGALGTPRATTVAGRALLQSGIDEVPLLAALSTRADGPTTVRDAADLRDKDTDRIAGMVELLTAFGGVAHATPDGLVVEPSTLRSPGVVELPADHRLIFAAFVLAALAGGGVELRGVSAAATSYPGLFDDLRHYLPLETR